MTVVVRPDLSNRTALSKSALTQFELCPTKSWFSIHDKRPFVPNEKVTFGSAVDAGVEQMAWDLRAGLPIDEGKAFGAAAEIVERDNVELVFSQVESALRTFAVNVAPMYDWTDVALQSHLNATLEGLGEVDGHPDLIWPNNIVRDVKTGKPKKSAETPELGLYAMLVEAVTGKRVPAVGYIFYDRSLVTPKWGTVEAEFTDAFQRWAYERASAFARAKQGDALLNADAAEPINYTMTGGPKFDGLCSDCVYNPALGGPCSMTYTKEAVA
jgi:CRISPR/Cas system-associated exonuclease Cas4 (RecB family)